MRTTIELTDEQRARLLKMAAERGEKGFSHLVREALDRYLEQESLREERIAAARAVLGTLNDKEAESLRESVRQLRESWR